MKLGGAPRHVEIVDLVQRLISKVLQMKFNLIDLAVLLGFFRAL